MNDGAAPLRRQREPRFPAFSWRLRETLDPTGR